VARAGAEAGSSIADIFLTRLHDLEKRVERELDRPADGTGPVGAFALDLAREAWRVGSSLAQGVSSPAGRRDILASWTASRPVDDLGLDLVLAETVRELLRPLARRWLGLSESRSAVLPEEGGVLILLNRSAWPLPVEALVMWAFLCDGRVGARPMVALWDEDLPELPYVSDFLRRIGLFAATADNARVLLERGAVVLAFPEGPAARAKFYDRRYRLARFQARELIAAAVEAGARIVPAAVVGNEESYPLLGHLGWLPVTAQFPLLGPLGVLPLPRTWTLRLGSSVEYAAGESERPPLDGILDAIRARMQSMVGELLSQR
jgi:1-acyl-sn-glycerol-3-phosphate acyltransferase